MNIGDKISYVVWGLGAREHTFYVWGEDVLSVTFRDDTKLEVITEMVDRGMNEEEIQNYIDL